MGRRLYPATPAYVHPIKGVRVIGLSFIFSDILNPTGKIGAWFDVWPPLAKTTIHFMEYEGAQISLAEFAGLTANRTVSIVVRSCNFAGETSENIGERLRKKKMPEITSLEFRGLAKVQIDEVLCRSAFW